MPRLPFAPLCWIIIVLLFAGKLSAQDSIPPARDSSVRIFATPLVYFTPDTYWAFGAAGILTFRGSPQRSSVSFSIAYTLRKQLLIGFPYQWYSPAGYWRAYGEVGWYRYLYQYFGIGNKYPNDYKETYVARYPRLRITALRRVHRHELAGLRFGLDFYNILEASPGGELEAGAVTGTKGGTSSSFGPAWLFDSRDNQFYPRRGWFLETTVYAEAPWLGSDFRYARFYLDADRYFSFWKNKVLVVNMVCQASAGHPPFFAMAQLGGARWLRGYPAGKFRDRHSVLLQAELRFPLFWVFKGALFGGTGSVFGTPGERLRWRPNIGGGVRFEFDRKQHIHMRLDYGFGEKSSGLYLTVGEAF